MGKTVKIALVRSLIGRTEKQRRIVKGLGLGKVNSSVIRKDTPEIQGMVKKINFMLHVEEMD